METREGFFVADTSFIGRRTYMKKLNFWKGILTICGVNLAVLILLKAFPNEIFGLPLAITTIVFSTLFGGASIAAEGNEGKVDKGLASVVVLATLAAFVCSSAASFFGML